jgi:hypothetical protein
MTLHDNKPILIGQEVREADVTVPVVVHMPRVGYGESPWIDDRMSGDDYLDEHKELAVAFHLARKLDWESAKALICSILDRTDGKEVAKLLDMLTIRFEDYLDLDEIAA